MRRKTHRMIVLVLIVVMVIARVSGVASAKTSYVISGDRNGLEIRIPQKTVDTGNLNPGDKKSSSLQLLNTGSSVLNVYIRTNILGETSPRGGRLADVMTLTIKAEDELISDGTFREVAKEGYVLIGSIAPETTKTIYFSADFPEDAGNDYQGASLRVNWTFLTESVGGGGDDNGDDDDDDGDNGKKEPPIEVEEEPVPRGEPTIPDVPVPVPTEPDQPVVDIPEEEVPSGPPDMPETGERVRYPFYIIGTFAILAGVSIIKKRL